MGWSFIDITDVAWYHKLWIYPAIYLYLAVGFLASVAAFIGAGFSWLFRKVKKLV